MGFLLFFLMILYGVKATGNAMSCRGVLDIMGTPIPMGYCVANMNFESNTPSSFKYQCSSDKNYVNQLFYDNLDCQGSPSEIINSTMNVIDFNCDTNIQCDVFDIQISRDVECDNFQAITIKSNNISSSVSNILSLGIIPDQCLNLTPLGLLTNAASGIFTCNSTYYSVIHYDDAHCQGNTVDIFKFGGCEDNVDIQVLQCFHPTVFVTTQSLLTMDIFDSIPDSTNERQGDDILRTHTLPPDSIEYEDHSIQNVLSIVLGLFILVIYAI